jgi:radical SAM protein with 4Fe4S-binding SPASM domain
MSDSTIIEPSKKHLQAFKPDYTEERNDRFLYFWGNFPHWLVTNETGREILFFLFKGKEIESILSFYQRETNCSREESEKDLYNFFRPLIQVGVVYEQHSPPAIPTLKEQFSLDTAKKSIASVVLNPTSACNYRCKHCYTNSSVPLQYELALDEMISILEQISPFMHPKILGFLGGEPLLRKEDVLAVSKFWIQEKDGYASVSTNGSLLDSTFAKKAAEINLVVQISLDGATPETCDQIRGDGAWKRAVAAAEACIKEEVLCWLCMVYTKDNIAELEDFIKLGLDLGVHGVRFIPYNYLGRGASSDLVKVMPFQMIKEVHRILRKHPDWGDFISQSFFGNISVIVRTAPRYVYCGSGLATLLIESNGDLYPCINLVYPEFKVGNLREKPFEELWFKSPILEKIRSLCVEDANDKCASCIVRYMCGLGCRSEIYELTRRINLPTFFCESWKKSIFEMCWILDEFPQLHEKVTNQRQTWPAQHKSLINKEKAQLLMDSIHMCG